MGAFFFCGSGASIIKIDSCQRNGDKRCKLKDLKHFRDEWLAGLRIPVSARGLYGGSSSRRDTDRCTPCAAAATQAPSASMPRLAWSERGFTILKIDSCSR